MILSRSRLAAWLAATCVILGAGPAAAQITLSAAPGQTPRASFINSYSSVSVNQFNGLADGTTQVQFGSIGSALLTGASVQGGQVADLGADGLFGLSFSRPIAGFFGSFGKVGGPLVLTFRSRGATLATLTTSLPAGRMTFLGISDLTFDAIGVAGAAGGQLRMDDVVIGVNGVAPAVVVTATPEPATVALLGLGLAGLGVVSRRRARVVRNG